MTRKAFFLTIGAAFASIAAKFRPAPPDLLDGKRTLLVVADDKAMADALLKYIPLSDPKFKIKGRMWYHSDHSIEEGLRTGWALDADRCATVMARGCMDFYDMDGCGLSLTIATRVAILDSPKPQHFRNNPLRSRCVVGSSGRAIFSNPPVWQRVVFECPSSQKMLKLIRPHLTPDAEILA